MLNIERNIYETTALGIKTMSISDRFLEERIIFLDGAIEEGTGAEISKQLLYLDSINHKPIKLYINSPGGICSEGLQILDTMELINSPVYTFNIGECCSMAFAILVRGDKRFSYRDAEAMCHQASGGAFGNIQDMRISMESIERINKVLAEKIAEALDIDIEDYYNLTIRDKWLAPEEMLDLGGIDKILTPKKNREGKRNFTK